MSIVSIVIPTLNESENINPLLERVFACCGTEDTEVIFVDDNSADNTRDLIRAWEGSHPVRLVAREGKKGLSSAVMDGAKVARGGIVVVMDADLSHPPETIPLLVSHIAGGSADMAIGSRYVEGGSTPDWLLSRKITSKVATLMARPFTRAADPMSGFFAVKREAFSGLKGDLPGFKVGLELLVAGGEGMKVREVPIEFRDRTCGESKLGMGTICAYLFQLLSLSSRQFPLSIVGNLFLAYFLSSFADGLLVMVLERAGVPFTQGHLAGFAVMLFLVFLLNRDMAAWAFGRQGTGGKRAPWFGREAQPVSQMFSKNGFRLFAVPVALLFLRGGILLSLVQLNNWPLLPAIFTANGVVMAFLAGGVYWFTHSEGDSERKFRGGVICISAYAFALKLAYMGVFELMHQEAYYWNYAMHANIGYLDHPPMVAWIIWVFTTIFGNSEMAVRMGAPVCWMIMAFFSYALTKRLFDRTAAAVSLLLLSFLPFYFGIGLLMTPDAPLSAAWAGAVCFFHKALTEEDGPAWLWGGICLGVGMLSKYTIILIVPATCIFCVIDRRSRRWFFRPEPYMALLAAFVLFLPVIIWNADNQWASFNFQGARRFQGSFNFSSHLLLLYVLAILTPTALLAVGSLLGKLFMRRTGSLRDLNSRNRLFFMVYTLFPLSVFLFFSLFRTVKLNWTGPLWLVLIPLLAGVMTSGLRDGSSGFMLSPGKAWSRTMVFTLLLFGAVLHYFTLGFPGVSYPQNTMLLGWSDLGSQIEKISRDIESETGRKPLVVGMDKYKTASGLAFYRTKASAGTAVSRKETPAYTTSGRHYFGKNSLMYRYWFPGSEKETRDMILVAGNRRKLQGIGSSLNADGVGQINRILLTKNGKSAGSVFYSIIRGDQSDPEGKGALAGTKEIRDSEVKSSKLINTIISKGTVGAG